MKLEKHIPCGYVFIIVEHENDKLLSDRIKRENYSEDFIEELEKRAKDISNCKQYHLFFRGNTQCQRNLSITAGFAKKLPKKTKKRFWTIVTKLVSCQVCNLKKDY